MHYKVIIVIIHKKKIIYEKETVQSRPSLQARKDGWRHIHSDEFPLHRAIAIRWAR